MDDFSPVTTVTLNNTGGGLIRLATLSDMTETDDVMSKWWLRVIFVVLYSAIFVIGLSGNAIVVYIVARNKAMHTITNTFIANLAVSDIMMCLFAVPFTPAAALLQSWTFGETLCHVVPMTLGVSVHVSTLTSTAIAIDRYVVIVHPFKRRMNLFFCVLLIVAIWITSVSISLPLAVNQKVSWDSREEIFYCHEYWPKPAARQFFTITSFVLQYILPCSVITYCYTNVSRVLRERAQAKMASRKRPGERELLDLKRHRRTNRMLIAMVSIFVCCWLPLNVLHVVRDYASTEIYATNYYMLMFLIVHVTAMSSTNYNPFIYGGMNENFKKEFKKLLPKLFPGPRQVTCNAKDSAYVTLDTVDPTPRFELREEYKRDETNMLPIRGTEGCIDVGLHPVAVNVLSDVMIISTSDTRVLSHKIAADGVDTIS